MAVYGMVTGLECFGCPDEQTMVLAIKLLIMILIWHVIERVVQSQTVDRVIEEMRTVMMGKIFDESKAAKGLRRDQIRVCPN